MIFLDATIVNVALPDIQNDFDAGEQGLQWVVAAYSLTMGMFIMSAATLADQTGVAGAFFLGTVIFAAASALCGGAPSLFVLNLGRGRPGRRRRHRERGLAGPGERRLPRSQDARPGPSASGPASPSLGLAIGPTVGGFLTEIVGWRSIFLVNVVIGAVGVVLVRAFVEESTRSDAARASTSPASCCSSSPSARSPTR